MNARILEGALDYARKHDAADPLRDFRGRFALPLDARREPLLYLCGHSLGPQPLAARERVAEELEDWASLAVRGHEAARRPWIHYHENMAVGLEHLTGALPGEVVAMSSLTVNLHFMLASFYRPRGARTKILVESGAFSSDRHAVVTHIAWHGLDAAVHLIELAPPPGEDLIAEDAIERCLAERGDEIALVMWPGVQYRTGQAFDLARIARAAHRAGCRVGFDLAHAIGNLPLGLHDCGADFAVWCSYKYLNSGPGAIGGCFVHERHADPATVPRLAGWWGHDVATRFRMQPDFHATAGAPGWQVSNPPILSAAPLVASLEIFRAAHIERLREKSIALTGFLESLLRPLSHEVRIVTPRDPAARGCQLSLRIADPRGSAVFDWLNAHGAVCDWREPDIIRVAPAPLYNRFEDVYRFTALLAQALRETR